MHSLISNLPLYNLKYKHLYIKERIVKSIGYLIISTNRCLVVP